MNEQTLLFQAFVYLCAAVISVPIAKRLGLGSVLGYIIAGIWIGPFGLEFVAVEQDIMHFAEFGVVMMLFLIGLELRPILLWRMRISLFGMGGMQFFLTAGIVCAIAMAFGLDWKFSLAVGLIAAPSSTAIILQTMQEKGWMSTQGGRASFSVLLFQDLAIIPILALLPLLATAKSVPVDIEAGSNSLNLMKELPAWSSTLVIILAIGAVILAGRFLLNPMMRLMAETRLREIFTATALWLIISIALLMEAVNLSPALGTFIAGVVLAESEFRHELESDIQPFKGLLLGLFFISVGASINFDLFVAKPFLIAGLVVFLVAIKAGVLMVVGFVFRRRAREVMRFTMLLAQGSEFAFVLLAFSATNGIMAQEQVEPLVLAVALSMVLAPILIISFEKLDLMFTSDTLDELDDDDNITDHRPHAIIAGFGRFGQIVGRLVIANGFRVTVFDQNPSQIDLLKKFNANVYFGDGSRLDLLKAAGADKASILVIAADDREKVTQIARLAHLKFPDLYILARATDRRHAYELIELGVDVVEREMFGSALQMGKKALVALGYRAFQAERAGEMFRRFDHEGLRHLSKIEFGSDQYREQVHLMTQDLERIMTRDKVRFSEMRGDKDWEH